MEAVKPIRATAAKEVAEVSVKTGRASVVIVAAYLIPVASTVLDLRSPWFDSVGFVNR